MLNRYHDLAFRAVLKLRESKEPATIVSNLVNIRLLYNAIALIMETHTHIFQIGILTIEKDLLVKNTYGS